MRVDLSASVRRRLSPLDRVNRVDVPEPRSSPLFTVNNPKYYNWLLIMANNEDGRSEAGTTKPAPAAV